MKEGRPGRRCGRCRQGQCRPWRSDWSGGWCCWSSPSRYSSRRRCVPPPPPSSCPPLPLFLLSLSPPSPLLLSPSSPSLGNEDSCGGFRGHWIWGEGNGLLSPPPSPPPLRALAFLPRASFSPLSCSVRSQTFDPGGALGCPPPWHRLLLWPFTLFIYLFLIE